MIYFSALLISLFTTIALIPLLMRAGGWLHAMDFPNPRKVHTAPIPKTGGIAMAMGALIPIILWAPFSPLLKGLLAGVGIVTLFGLLDDFLELGYKVKFFGQLTAALVVILYGGIKITHVGLLMPEGYVMPDWLSIPVTLVTIVGVTNAINLADGLDGLAGGICLLIFCCIGYLAYQGENVTIALIAVAVGGAIFGFLRFNTYPAVLFMGDAGSEFLGFTAVTTALAITQGNTPLSPLLPLVILGFPILDTVTVMGERIAQKRSPFVADQSHFHHRLMGMGLFHTEAVFCIYVLQALLVSAAYFLRFHSEWILFAGSMGLSAVIIVGFYVAGRRGWKFQRRSVFERVVKGKLKVLKEKGVLIRLSFGVVEAGIPLLLLITCLLPVTVPRYISLVSLTFLGILLACSWFWEERLGGVLRAILYLLIPFVVYLGQKEMVAWMSEQVIDLYNLSFGVLVVFVIFTLKGTRRKKGFQITPMDFLILFIAVVVPNFPDPTIRHFQMGLVAGKIIMLFFSYEVLMGELRGNFHRLVYATIPALIIVTVKGFVG